MMKNKKFALVLMAMFLSCISKTSSESDKQFNINQNLYDLYYMEKLTKNEGFRYANLDSLGVIKNTDDLFKSLVRKKFLDYDIANRISNNKISNTLNYKIILSDTVINKIKSQNKIEPKYEVVEFFSKPFKISNKKCIVFVETSHLIGGSNSVVFYSKEETNRWKLDSIKLLGNYRGGGI